MCVYHAHGGQNRLLEPVEVELQAVVSCSPWVLGTEPRSSEEQISSSEPPHQPQAATLKIYFTDSCSRGLRPSSASTGLTFWAAVRGFELRDKSVRGCGSGQAWPFNTKGFVSSKIYNKSYNYFEWAGSLFPTETPFCWAVHIGFWGLTNLVSTSHN